MTPRSRHFPGFDRLYTLSIMLAEDAFLGGHSRRRDACAILRGEVTVPPSDPVRVPWMLGSHVPGDVIWTVTLGDVVVSARLIDVLLDHRLTGWSTYPVRVTGKFGEEIGGYYGLSVTGRCDPADLGRSTVVMRERPAGWFPFHRGRYFDEASWDGSDLFMERRDERGHATGYVYVTERVRAALRAAGVTNVTLQRLSEWEALSRQHPHLWPDGFAERVARSQAAFEWRRGTGSRRSIPE